MVMLRDGVVDPALLTPDAAGRVAAATRGYAAPPVREAVLAVVRATLSTQGYSQTRDVMRLNGELGTLVGQYPDTLTEWIYWFSIFGRPSTDEPEPFHVHTVVRTPDGNDYGKDMLRQHLALHRH
jgi:hypothetical protein